MPTEDSSTGALPVFGLAIIEIWAAVPAGVAIGLPAIVIWVVTICGSMLGVVVVAFAGDAFRERLVQRFAHGGPGERGRLRRLWERYGVPGWGLVSPLVFAPAMGAGIALLLGAPRNRILVWMAVGVVIWTTILVGAAELGLGLLQQAR